MTMSAEGQEGIPRAMELVEAAYAACERRRPGSDERSSRLSHQPRTHDGGSSAVIDMSPPSIAACGTPGSASRLPHDDWLVLHEWDRLIKVQDVDAFLKAIQRSARRCG
jgi:hypothetical protein